jgi:hypothetical protein
MTPTQRLMARHALGLPNEQSRSYRNYYVAHLGAETERAWDDMVANGLAHRGQRPSEMARFCLSFKGAQAAINPGETLDREDFPEAR